MNATSRGRESSIEFMLPEASLDVEACCHPAMNPLIKMLLNLNAGAIMEAPIVRIISMQRMLIDVFFTFLIVCKKEYGS